MSDADKEAIEEIEETVNILLESEKDYQKRVELMKKSKIKCLQPEDLKLSPAEVSKKAVQLVKDTDPQFKENTAFACYTFVLDTLVGKKRVADLNLHYNKPYISTLTKALLPYMKNPKMKKRMAARVKDGLRRVNEVQKEIQVTRLDKIFKLEAPYIIGDLEKSLKMLDPDNKYFTATNVVDKYFKESFLEEIAYVNDKGDKVPRTCPKCGGEVKVFLKGEPVFLCTECEKYFGTVPFSEAVVTEGLFGKKKNNAPVVNHDEVIERAMNDYNNALKATADDFYEYEYVLKYLHIKPSDFAKYYCSKHSPSCKNFEQFEKSCMGGGYEDMDNGLLKQLRNEFRNGLYEVRFDDNSTIMSASGSIYEFIEDEPYFDKKNEFDDFRTDIEPSELKEADAKLGYYLLSTPPKGVKPKPLPKGFPAKRTNIRESDGSLIEGFLKKKNDRYTEVKPEDLDTEKQDTMDIVTARVREIVRRYNKDPNMQKKIRKDLDVFMKANDITIDSDEFDGFNKNRNVPKLTCGVEIVNEKFMALSIYDGSQYVRQALHKTIEHIEKELMKDRMISSLPGLLSVDTGDGDEGCLYVNFKC
jgi:hypothetical protein